MPYSRASIFVGLPSSEVLADLDEVMDARLSHSSLGSVSAALRLWDIVIARHGWGRIIMSDDPTRGGKLATWVRYMIYETDLVADSISNYVWALRSWMKYQRQLDPVFGISEWDDLMAATHVVAWVQGEPRKRVPLELVRDSLRRVNTSVFWEVQAAFLMLMLLFTFARSETPCPKSFTGEGALDPEKHLLVRDVSVRRLNDRSYVAVRLKAIKQDPRMERPSARGNEDWVIIGDAPGDMSILTWVSHLFRLHGGARSPEDPFFLDRDRHRPLTYTNATKDLRALWARASCGALANTLGPHGLRVEGYNAGKRYNKELTVAHGGWSSDAHERYERFHMNEVLDLSSEIAAQCDSEADNSEYAELHAPARLAQPAPRPDRIRAGTGRQRGVMRQRQLHPAAAPAPAPAHAREQSRLPARGTRIEIYWTEERAWFACMVHACANDGAVRVVYDKEHARQRVHERTFVHDLHAERWRLLES